MGDCSSAGAAGVPFGAAEIEEAARGGSQMLRIRPGMRADLILFTLENFKINIIKTMVAGEVVYESGK